MLVQAREQVTLSFTGVYDKGAGNHTPKAPMRPPVVYLDAYNRSNGRYYEGYWVDIENFDLFLRSYYHAQTLSMNDPRIHQYPYLALHFYGETIETKDSRYNVYFPSAGSFLPYDTPSSQSIIYTFLNHFEQ